MTDLRVSAAAMRVMRLLVGRRPRPINDLVDATGVTRTAVTEQLHELASAGFVERRTERLEGRGRPRHLYFATDSAMILLFGNSQRMVVPAIWQAIHEVGGKPLSRKVLRRVSRALAEHYNQRITAEDPQQRLMEFTELLREEGGLVEALNQGGQLVLRKRSCPFVSMLDDRHSVCCVDQQMMAEVVGRRVKRMTCRYEGDPCCTFEIVAEGA